MIVKVAGRLEERKCCVVISSGIDQTHTNPPSIFDCRSRFDTQNSAYDNLINFIFMAI